jgi:large exoprotein involved in heme utilization and adhesion
VIAVQAALSGSAGIMNINQSSHQAIINWQSFAIGAGQMAYFSMTYTC